MRIHSKYFEQEFIELYKLQDRLDRNGYVYCEVQLGMYGLKQAAILAYKQIKERLEKKGYHPIPGTTGLWKHTTQKITFALCVDNFGVKYFKKEDVEHLCDSLREYYKISTDWKGSDYCGLLLKWNYEQGYIDISMPGYVLKAQKSTNTLLQKSHNMHHINGTHPFMGRKYRWPTNQTTLSF